MSYRQAFRTTLAMLLVAGALSAPLLAQPSLAHARDLYVAADYEGALAALGDLRPSDGEATEAGTYKVLCLLALGRSLEATREIESLVATDPFYQLPDTMASPRVRDVFRQTRLKALPAVAQREYTEAKAAFDRRDPEAAKMFERVLALLDEPGLLYSPTAADLRLLAAGFRDLSREFAAQKAQAAPASPPSPQAAAQAAATRPTDVPSAETRPAAPPADAAAATAPRAAPAASATPAPNPTAPQSTASTEEPAPPSTAGGSNARTARADAPAHEGDPGVTPPVPIAQPMPRWIPPTGSTARREQFEGVLELLIDARGSVAHAVLRMPVHPGFDDELLKVARTWTFKPAMRAGVPTPYVKFLQVRLSPPR